MKAKLVKESLNEQKEIAPIEIQKLYNAIKNDHSIQRYSLGWNDVINVIDKNYEKIEKFNEEFNNKLLIDAIKVSHEKVKKQIEAFARELNISMETLRDKYKIKSMK